MLKRAASLTLLLVATSAHADETQTTTANTLVVVTPNAPIVVQQGGAPQQVEPALAPPGATENPPPAPTAPQNEDWRNVSHINGVPVKVGERNDYLYKFKRTNLAVNPFGAFFGYYDASASFALGQNLALSVGLTGWSVDHGNSSGYQATASLPIYFRRTYSGPYLEPGVIARSTTHRVYYDCINGGGCGGDPADTWAGVELLLGWQWSFDSGLNIAAAFGVARHVTDNQMSYNSDEPDAAGYFRVGYAF